MCMETTGILGSLLHHFCMFYLILTSGAFILRTIFYDGLFFYGGKNNGHSISKTSPKFCDTCKLVKVIKWKLC